MNEQHKRAAAERAVELVRPGMVLGLGSGSTALFAVQRIGQLFAAGSLAGIAGIPTSRAVAAEATRLGIPLGTLEAHPLIDLTIDGADEVDPALDLIKGKGGALLHEKIVAQASRRVVIVVDASKTSAVLGTRSALPVEVLEFGWRSQARFLESLGAAVQPRENYRTDEDNLILDCNFGRLAQPRELARQLETRAGIVEHGLFLGLATDLVVAGDDGIRLASR